MKILLVLSIFLVLRAEAAAKVKVAIINVPPFGMERSGELQGIHVDFIKEVLKEAEVEGSLRLLPYKRVVSNTKMGKSDLTLIFKRKNPDEMVEVAKSIPFKNIVLARKGADLNQIADLKKKRVGIIRNASYEDAFDRLEDINRVPLRNYLQGYLMVEKGRLDAVVTPLPAFQYAKKSQQRSFKNLATAFVLNEKHNYFYASKNLDQKIVERIKKANKKVLGSKIPEKILKHYLSESDPESLPFRIGLALDSSR